MPGGNPAVVVVCWCRAFSRAGLALAKDGDPLVYGPVDVTVGSPERLIYEGEVSLGKGIERLPRISSVSGGNAVLCAAELIAFADQHAPVKRFNELVAEGEERAGVPRRAGRGQGGVSRRPHREGGGAGQAAGGGREGVRPGDPRGSRRQPTGGSGASCRRIMYCTAPTARHSSRPRWPTTRRTFHGKECCDPVEGLDYQSRNCGFILHQGGRIEIYSRAHGDRYAYFLPLIDDERRQRACERPEQ